VGGQRLASGKQLIAPICNVYDGAGRACFEHGRPESKKSMKRMPVASMFALLMLGAPHISRAFTVAIPSPVTQAASQIGSAFPPLAWPLNLTSFPADILTGSTSGHEEITRQAMNRLEIGLAGRGLDLRKLSPEFMGNREVEITGTNGLVSRNMIIRGNYATDLPFGLIDDFDVPKWHGLPLQGWTNNPKGQVLHFLQNRNDDGSLVSQRDTCNQAKDEIARTTTEGLRLWRAGNIKVALFLFGHATHTIQDSFSPAHTVRAGAADNHDLLNVCYYGQPLNVGDKACYHAVPDFRDDIWLGNILALTNKVGSAVPLDEIKERSIKAEAQLARTATMRYLYSIVKLLFEGTEKDLDSVQVRAMLDRRLFEGVTGMTAVDQGLAKEDQSLPIPMSRGIMRCEKLNSAPLIPANETEDKRFAAPRQGG